MWQVPKNVPSNENQTPIDRSAAVIASLSGEAKAIAADLKAMYKREGDLLGGIASREKRIKALEAEVEKLKAASRQLENLRKSKLVRLQRAYWRLRKKLRK